MKYLGLMIDNKPNRNEKKVVKKKTYMNKLNTMQRKILNALTGVYRTVNTEKLLKLLKIYSLEEELII